MLMRKLQIHLVRQMNQALPPLPIYTPLLITNVIMMKRMTRTVSPKPVSKSNSIYRPIRKTESSSTTSSSNGMIFRVPFKEKAAVTSNTEALLESNLSLQELSRRRSSLMSIPSGELLRSSISEAEHQRRASHPLTSSPLFEDSGTPCGKQLQQLQQHTIQNPHNHLSPRRFFKKCKKFNFLREFFFRQTWKFNF